jgi:hypothetical protein
VSPLEIRVKFFHTLWADTMAEFGLGMVLDISFDLIPVTFVISNLFARSTDR